MQILGILIALGGLVGYWLTRDVERAVLDEETRRVLNVEEGEFQASFVVAGRDIFYESGKSEPIYGRNGAIVGWDYRGVKSAYGTNTDTILYASVVGNEVTLINIPRDIWLDAWSTKINTMYYYKEADGLRNAVSDLLGLPVDYYAVVNIDIFQGLVDALGGVEVNVPERMKYSDRAAGLDIDLEPGPQTLDGKKAADFVRYRHTARGDFDRVDRVKTLALAMLARLKELNVRAVGRVPALLATYSDEVETNASPALLSQLLVKLPDLQIRQVATLPTCCERRIVWQGDAVEVLSVDRAAVETFVADTFGGAARELVEVPDTPLVITNRSGVPGLGRAVKTYLVGSGISEELLSVREASPDPAPTRILVTAPAWGEADYYATLFHDMSKQQIDSLQPVDGNPTRMELVLGTDAENFALAQALAGGGEQ